jgi:hypothetical protein
MRMDSPNQKKPNVLNAKKTFELNLWFHKGIIPKKTIEVIEVAKKEMKKSVIPV